MNENQFTNKEIIILNDALCYYNNEDLGVEEDVTNLILKLDEMIVK